MKNGICVILGVILITLIGTRFIGSKPTPLQKSSVSPTKIISKNTLSRSIFIPYWAPEIQKSDTSFDTYYYFGIQPTTDGSIENELGLRNIPLVKNIPEKQKKLVLRMLDSSVTDILLDEKSAQAKLLSEIKAILDKDSFSGMVLDIEVPFSFNSEKKDKISNFVQQMCTGIKSNYKTCSLLIYGDAFYRSRPFDIKKLGSIVDHILVMSYDFHKAGGEPGPNFDFDSAGYNFKQMVADFSLVVPKEKLEIVFGMYGYDWTLNEQGTPLKNAKALSLKEIQLGISNNKFQITNQSQNSNSKEKNILYTDEEGRKHTIWYEDEESAALKTKYLQLQGLWQTSFWAYSYF